MIQRTFVIDWPQSAGLAQGATIDRPLHFLLLRIQLFSLECSSFNKALDQLPHSGSESTGNSITKSTKSLCEKNEKTNLIKNKLQFPFNLFLAGFSQKQLRILVIVFTISFPFHKLIFFLYSKLARLTSLIRLKKNSITLIYLNLTLTENLSNKALAIIKI
jgi:hypothetical protein